MKEKDRYFNLKSVLNNHVWEQFYLKDNLKLVSGAGHPERAAPASSQSRIFKAGVTDTLNPAFGFMYQSATRPL